MKLVSMKHDYSEATGLTSKKPGGRDPTKSPLLGLGEGLFCLPASRSS